VICAKFLVTNGRPVTAPLVTTRPRAELSVSTIGGMRKQPRRARLVCKLEVKFEVKCFSYRDVYG